MNWCVKCCRLVTNLARFLIVWKLHNNISWSNATEITPAAFQALKISIDQQDNRINVPRSNHEYCSHEYLPGPQKMVANLRCMYQKHEATRNARCYQVNWRLNSEFNMWIQSCSLKCPCHGITWALGNRRRHYKHSPIVQMSANTDVNKITIQAKHT